MGMEIERSFQLIVQHGHVHCLQIGIKVASKNTNCMDYGISECQCRDIIFCAEQDQVQV